MPVRLRRTPRRPAPPPGRGEFRIGFLVHDVSRLRQTLFDQRMRPHGVTRAQWRVLAQLSRNPAGAMGQTELARLLGLGKVATGTMIDRLAAAGLVTRHDDASDRRVRRVAMTGKGRALLDQCVAIARPLNAAVLSGLAPEDLQAADRVLTAMKRNLRQMLQDAPPAEDDPGFPQA